MPALPEAILLTGGSPARARAILASMVPLSSTFCLGHLPEIMDAATPHTPGGCGAQAWSVSELLRVEKLLSDGLPALG
jgi:glycogen debranching enzyme